jgi:hypothetical protein
VDYGLVDSSHAALVYKQATLGQLPSEPLQDPRYQAYFIKRPHHVGGNILMFTPSVLDFLLGSTDAPPGMLQWHMRCFAKMYCMLFSLYSCN